MAGYIEDLWLTKRRDPDTGKRRRKTTYGVGMRYRVKGIPGVRDRSFELLDDAKTWLNDANTDSRRAEFVDPRDGKILLRDYVETHWWPNAGYGGSTAETVGNYVWGHILTHLGHLPLNGIGVPELRTWMTAVRSNLAVSTTNTVWSYLSSILQAAVDDGRLARNVCQSSKTVRPPTVTNKAARAWSAHTVAAIRDGLKPRHRILLDLGLGLGLRQGEAFGFSPDDISDGVVHVRRQVLRVKSQLYFGPPKGGKERWVPIPPGLEKRVRQYAEQEFTPASVTLPWLDPNKPGQAREDMRRITVPLLATTQRKAANNRSDWNPLTWKPALAAAGLIEAEDETGAAGGRPRWEPSRELGFHCLRHTFASVQLEAGESPVTLSKWLGHSSPTITFEHYAHFMPEAGARGLAAMDAWFT